jgi:hypothetical protein
MKGERKKGWKDRRNEKMKGFSIENRISYSV